MTFRPIAGALLLALLLPFGASEARAQRALPAGAVAVPDSLPAGRQVRSFPVTFGGAVLGGAVGLAAGALAGAALGAASDDANSGGYEFGALIGGSLGGIVGYSIGAPLGARFAASGRPRPSPWPAVGVSVLSAVVVGVVAGGGLGSAELSESESYVLAVAVPVAHLVLTTQFARWRASRR